MGTRVGAMTDLDYGWLTPVLSYAMAVVGCGLGLRCTLRALATEGRTRRNWLVTAATAIGAGIWTMHFVGMLGFAVSGTEVHYDVPLTVVSLLVAVGFAALGLLLLGRGRTGPGTLLGAGTTVGLGAASMHYLGMLALRLHGALSFDAPTVALSVAVAVAGTTGALWAAVTLRGPAAGPAAALGLGGAVTGMHYLGMAAARISVRPAPGALPGVAAMDFVFPLSVGLGSYLFLTAAFVALAPSPHAAALGPELS